MSRLLVVDDDSDIALALRLLFVNAGYDVICVSDGRSALREAHNTRPDLVVLDIGLPEMDGWMVLERLRDISDVPVLVLTAHGKDAEKVRGLRGGADDYLTKPFGNAELLARVEALLRRSSDATSWANEVYDDGRGPRGPRPAAGLRGGGRGEPDPDGVPPAQHAGAPRRRGAVGQPAAASRLGRPERHRPGAGQVRRAPAAPQARLVVTRLLPRRGGTRVRLPLPPTAGGARPER